MIEAVLGALVMGVTAGVCPINMTMLSPIVPKLIKSGGRLRIAILFSTGLAIVFVPLGAAASLAGALLQPQAMRAVSFVAGALMVVIGLWALRVIHLPMPRASLGAGAGAGSGSGPGAGSSAGGSLAFGIAYALATAGRGAPLLLSTLSLLAANGEPLTGGVAMLTYAAGMGVPMWVVAAVLAAGGAEKEAQVVRLSKALDRVTGVMLLVLGAYYIAASLLYGYI